MNNESEGKQKILKTLSLIATIIIVIIIVALLINWESNKSKNAYKPAPTTKQVVQDNGKETKNFRISLSVRTGVTNRISFPGCQNSPKTNLKIATKDEVIEDITFTNNEVEYDWKKPENRPYKVTVTCQNGEYEVKDFINF